jgi:hypothetical protein
MAGDRVEMAPNSMLMIHEASGVCLGNAADMEEMAKLLALISDNIADAYAAKAGGTREQWREAMQAETWYLPEDAVTAGLADEALSVPKRGEPVEAEPGQEEPDMARAWDLAAYGYAGPAKPEAPKPGPPPAAEEPTTLTADIRSLVGEEVAEQLRAAAGEPGLDEPEKPAEPAPVEAPPTPEAGDPPATREPVNEWAATFAHLLQTEPDPWAQAFAHLTNPEASSSAATAA